MLPYCHYFVLLDEILVTKAMPVALVLHSLIVPLTVFFHSGPCKWYSWAIMVDHMAVLYEFLMWLMPFYFYELGFSELVRNPLISTLSSTFPSYSPGTVFSQRTLVQNSSRNKIYMHDERHQTEGSVESSEPDFTVHLLNNAKIDAVNSMQDGVIFRDSHMYIQQVEENLLTVGQV